MSTEWPVPKEYIESAVSLIDNVPLRSTIKSSEFIKVERAKAGATFSLCSDVAAKVTVVSSVKYPYETFFIDRRLFTPFVVGGQESKALEYRFILKKDQLIVLHGHRRATYSLVDDIAGYDEPKDLDKAKDTQLSKKFASLIDCAENFACSDPITPSLNCVYITQHERVLEALSTDQQLVFRGKAETDHKPLAGSIAFPLSLIPALKEEGANKFIWTDHVALIDFPKGRLWSAVKSAARKSFPVEDVKKTIKHALAQPVVISIASSTFTHAADRIGKYVAPIMSAELALEVHLTKDTKKVKIIAGDKDCKFNETIFALTKATQDLVLEWPLSKVLPILLFAKDEGSVRVHVSKENGSSCISTKQLTLVIAGRSK